MAQHGLVSAGFRSTLISTGSEVYPSIHLNFKSSKQQRSNTIKSTQLDWLPTPTMKVEQQKTTSTIGQKDKALERAPYQRRHRQTMKSPNEKEIHTNMYRRTKTKTSGLKQHINKGNASIGRNRIC